MIRRESAGCRVLAVMAIALVLALTVEFPGVEVSSSGNPFLVNLQRVTGYNRELPQGG